MIIKIGRKQRENSVYILFAIVLHSFFAIFWEKKTHLRKFIKKTKRNSPAPPQKKDRFCYRRQPENLRDINKTSYEIAKLVYPQVIVS